MLKALTNEAIRISMSTSAQTTNDQVRLKTLVETLIAGWRFSTSKTLPPVNWLNLVNTLLKSRLGGGHIEAELVELALGQIGDSNSAFALIKNYLIDTNYFTRLQVTFL